MRILLAVDMSECSDAAVRALSAQFAAGDHEVKVLYDVAWEEHLPASYLFAQGSAGAAAVVAFREELLRDANAYVDRVASALRAQGFSVTTEVVAEGDPRTVILDSAANWPADLIVVGSHGRSGLDRFLLGSVSERVVRHAPCSVEVVRTPAAASTRSA
jgi:nucleotide-binding universal stress UspA family protein